MKKAKLILFVSLILCVMLGSSCYAAWWGQSHYEWALSKGLTSIKTRSQLDKEVTLSDYYNIIMRYIDMKNITPKNILIQSAYTKDIYNGVLAGLIKDINSKIATTKYTLSPEDYRVVANLVDHGKKLAAEESDVLYRDNLKDLNLYLDLAKYRAAMLMQEDTKIKRQYKNSILYSLRNTKYASSLTYGIMPMSGSVTRKSTVLLLYKLQSYLEVNDDTIIDALYTSGILEGYDDYNRILKLEQNVTYTELFTLLHRFEVYDFESDVESETEEDTEIEEF